MLLALCLLEAAGVGLIYLALVLDRLDRPWS
jgi:hypothetical protein